MLRMELSGKRKWGRPKRRCMAAVREDMAVAEVMEKDAGCTVEPLIYDPPHERPPAIYDHISCNGW